jgi:ribosomal-protein-alanine N-acetyltransferase
MAEFPLLETERLILRAFRTSDAAAVLDLFSQDAVTRHHNIAPMLSMSSAKALVDSRRSRFDERAGIYWAITHRAMGDRMIGSCGCYHPHQALRSAEIGYELHPDYWRQGIMSEALTVTLDFCYGERFFFPLNRVQALTELDNWASIGLLKKLGFQEEGVLRAYGLWRGRFQDVRCFSLLRQEWLGRNRREPWAR